jgi:hypothetical protein
VQAAEAAGVLAASVLAGVDASSGKSYHTDSGVALTLIGVATAAALGYVAYGLARARRWSRTPALLTQLFTGIVGIYLTEGNRLDWGVAALALAVAGFIALLVPPSLRALAGSSGGLAPGPAAGSSRQPGRSQDGTSQGGASQGGASQGGASRDGASRDGASQDRVSRDRARRDAASRDRAGQKPGSARPGKAAQNGTSRPK